MACHLLRVGHIQELSGLKDFILADVLETEQKHGTKRPDDDMDWLNKCMVAVSPTASHVCLARGSNIVMLGGQRTNDVYEYTVKFSGALRMDERDTIRAILLLPMSSQKRSFQGGADWVCFVVGFSSGTVNFYTESGQLLLTQLFQEEPVLQLKCHTYRAAIVTGFNEQMDELNIVHSRCVVVVDGFVLFQTLRACRSQLARSIAAASTGSGGSSVQDSSIQNLAPLHYKKWGFTDIHQVVDCQFIGTTLPSFYDQLTTRVIQGSRYDRDLGRGFEPTPYSVVMVTGSNPYVGFYYAKEGSLQPLLSDVALAVASKLKNVISDRVTSALRMFNIGHSSQSDSPKQKPAIEPATSVPLRVGAFDADRKGNRISLSPNRRMAAVCDNHGRVVVFDVLRNCTIRIWKGYRDAECGWLEVEDRGSGQDQFKHTQYLVILAPKWKVLEVWCVHQNCRLSAFSINRYDRLVYNFHALLGLNNILMRHVQPNLFPCCLLTSEGILYALQVPFHRVLSEQPNKMVREVQLVNALRELVKLWDGQNEEGFVDDIGKHLSIIKSSQALSQVLQLFIGWSRLNQNILEKVIKIIQEKLNNLGVETRDFDSQQLEKSCSRVLQLANLHSVVQRSYDSHDLRNVGTLASIALPNPEILGRQFALDAEAIGNVQALVTLYEPLWQSAQKRVRFSISAPSLSRFLGWFQVSKSELSTTTGHGNGDILAVRLNEDKEGFLEHALGHFLFSEALKSDGTHDALFEAIEASGLQPKLIMDCLLRYYLSGVPRGDTDIWAQWLYLHRLLYFISSLAGDTARWTSLKISPWWRRIRRKIARSTNVLAAYQAVIVARGTAGMFQKVDVVQEGSGDEQDSIGVQPDTVSLISVASCMQKKDYQIAEGDDADDATWEQVGADMECFLTLYQQLQDLLPVCGLLHCELNRDQDVKIDDCEANFSQKDWESLRSQQLSLQVVLSDGKAVISESVAEWFCSMGVFPEELISLRGSCSEETVRQTTFTNCLITSDQAQYLLHEIVQAFPEEMDNYVLLLHCAWCFLLEWAKDHDRVYYLKMAQKFLEKLDDSTLQRGVCCLIWKTFLHKKYEVLVEHMEKTGVVPTDRVCRQCMEMNTMSLEAFVEFCIRLLDMLLDVEFSGSSGHYQQQQQHQQPESGESNRKKKRGPTVELWHGYPLSNDSRVCLYKACKTNSAPATPLDFELIKLHQVILLAVSLGVNFDLKGVRPISMFPASMAGSSYSGSMSEFEVSWNASAISAESDVMYEDGRVKFLLRAITAVVQSLPDVDPTSMFQLWRNRIGELMRSCRLEAANEDRLVQYWIIELVSSGHDHLAVEMMSQVRDANEIGLRVMELCCARIKHFIAGDEQQHKKMALLPLSLSRFLDTVSIELRCANPPVSGTRDLLRRVYHMIGDDRRKELAMQALESIDGIYSSTT